MTLKINRTPVVILLFVLISFSCEKEMKYSKLSKINILKRGEWFNTRDSLKVISVRNDKLAFINDSRNINFTSDDVYDYTIEDSIVKKGEVETVFGQYLVLKKNNNVTYFQVLSLNDSVIQFKKDNIIQKYEWKFRARISEIK